MILHIEIIKTKDMTKFELNFEQKLRTKAGTEDPVFSIAINIYFDY